MVIGQVQEEPRSLAPGGEGGGGIGQGGGRAHPDHEVSLVDSRCLHSDNTVHRVDERLRQAPQGLSGEGHGHRQGCSHRHGHRRHGTEEHELIERLACRWRQPVPEDGAVPEPLHLLRYGTRKVFHHEDPVSPGTNGEHTGTRLDGPFRLGRPFEPSGHPERSFASGEHTFGRAPTQSEATTAQRRTLMSLTPHGLTLSGETTGADYTTVTAMVWYPVAPPGRGATSSAVWVLPVPSVARVRSSWRPGVASQT